MAGILPRRLNDWLYLFAFVAIVLGFLLSIISWMRICSEECAESHNWCFCGLSFEFAGMLFFIPLLVIHGLSKIFPPLSFIAGLMLMGALGAEIKFILIQKYDIGTWCPICLCIASCIFVATICYGIMYFTDLKLLRKQGPKGEYMNSIWKGIAGISVFFLGFLLAVVGVYKPDALAAQEATLKDSIAFGDKTSPIEVYMFTDWACPACRQLEINLERMAPAIMAKARLTFVDYVIHTETLNYSPYNVSFMIKDKPEYFKLRDELTTLSLKNANPTEEDIQKIAEKVGIKYQPLNFADIALSQKYFKQLATQFGVSKTPTMVIINTKSKKGKKLVGIPEITESNVLKAIESLKGS